jgi:hypothetical protein
MRDGFGKFQRGGKIFQLEPSEIQIGERGRRLIVEKNKRKDIQMG